MRSFLMAVLASAALLGSTSPTSAASPKFTINQSDDRFRADTLTVISSDGNRISKKSIPGGRHIDKQGVYLNPVVLLDRNTGEINSLSFDLFNVVQKMSGIPENNTIGIPTRVSFLTGEGQPIALDVQGGDRRYGEPWCTSGVRSCFSLLIESGKVPIAIEDYRRLMAATALAIKIEGTEGSHIYEVPDVDPEFRTNLTTFYTAHLASTQ